MPLEELAASLEWLMKISCSPTSLFCWQSWSDFYHSSLLSSKWDYVCVDCLFAGNSRDSSFPFRLRHTVYSRVHILLDFWESFSDMLLESSRLFLNIILYYHQYATRMRNLQKSTSPVSEDHLGFPTVFPWWGFSLLLLTSEKAFLFALIISDIRDHKTKRINRTAVLGFITKNWWGHRFLEVVMMRRHMSHDEELQTTCTTWMTWTECYYSAGKFLYIITFCNTNIYFDMQGQEERWEA